MLRAFSSLVASQEVTLAPVNSAPKATGSQEPLMGFCDTQAKNLERLEASYQFLQEEVRYILIWVFIICCVLQKWDARRRMKPVLGDQIVGEAHWGVILYHCPPSENLEESFKGR